MGCLCHGSDLCSPHVGFRNAYMDPSDKVVSLHEDVSTSAQIQAVFFPISAYGYSRVHVVKLLSLLLFEKNNLYMLCRVMQNIVICSVL